MAICCCSLAHTTQSPLRADVQVDKFTKASNESKLGQFALIACFTFDGLEWASPCLDGKKWGRIAIDILRLNCVLPYFSTAVKWFAASKVCVMRQSIFFFDVLVHNSTTCDEARSNVHSHVVLPASGAAREVDARRRGSPAIMNSVIAAPHMYQSIGVWCMLYGKCFYGPDPHDRAPCLVLANGKLFAQAALSPEPAVMESASSVLKVRVGSCLRRRHVRKSIESMALSSQLKLGRKFVDARRLVART